MGIPDSYGVAPLASVSQRLNIVVYAPRILIVFGATDVTR